MSMTTTAQLTSSGLTTPFAPPRRSLFAWMRTMADAYRQSFERRAAVARLRDLNDHLLKDIGLDRSEIVSMVYGQPDGTRRDRASA